MNLEHILNQEDITPFKIEIQAYIRDIDNYTVDELDYLNHMCDKREASMANRYNVDINTIRFAVTAEIEKYWREKGYI